jgi:hypothetical protein
MCTLLLIGVSCKSRKIRRKTISADTATISIAALRAADCVFEELYCKGKARVTAGKNSLSFNYTLHLLRDSMIWLSASKLGIEAMRVRITPRKLEALDKINKKYYEKDLSVLQNELDYPIEFRLFQELLLANAGYLTNQPNIKPTDKKRSYRANFDNEFFLDMKLVDSLPKVGMIELRSHTGVVALFYTLFRNLDDNTLAPIRLQIKVKSNKKDNNFSGELELNHSEVSKKSFGSLSFNFSVPDSYEKEID